MNFWRLISLPMAVFCFTLAVLFTFVWWTPSYVFASVLGTATYIYMYVNETKKARRYR